MLSSIGVPQGFVIGPNLFSIYITQISNVASAFEVNIHQYSDDTQLYVAVDQSDDNLSIDALKKFSAAVNDWMLHNGLALDPDKSEAIMFGTARTLPHPRSKCLQYPVVLSPFPIE